MLGLKTIKYTMNYHSVFSFLCFLVVPIPTNSVLQVQLTVGEQTVNRIDPSRFLSVAIDTSFLRGEHYCGINWLRAIKLGRLLSGSYLRLGGDDADFMIFQEPTERIFSDDDEKSLPRLRSTNEETSSLPSERLHPFVPDAPAHQCNMFATDNFNVTKKQFDRINWFIQATGLRLILDLNGVMGFTEQQHKWNSTNTEQLIEYLATMGYEMDFELGNEEDDWPGWYPNVTTTGTQLVEAYVHLHKILKKYPIYAKSQIVGPAMGSSRSGLFKDFLTAGGTSQVMAVTFHHYYGDGRTSNISFFTDPKVLDSVIPSILSGVHLVEEIAKNQSVPKPEAWFGETASTYHGGTLDLSDRYAAGFMWLDKLGLSAKLGLTTVIRQTFFMGNYSLTDYQTYGNPDFWLSVLFKKLAGPDVRNVTVIQSQSASETAPLSSRFYAHVDGKKVTIYGMNLNAEPISVKIKNGPPSVSQYLFMPADDVTLNSQLIKVNDCVIPHASLSLPDCVKGKAIKLPFTVPPRSFGFWQYSMSSTKLEDDDDFFVMF